MTWCVQAYNHAAKSPNNLVLTYWQSQHNGTLYVGVTCDLTPKGFIITAKSAEPELIYTQRGEQIKIENTLTYKRLLEQADYETR